jgi:hypothetical protein
MHRKSQNPYRANGKGPRSTKKLRVTHSSAKRKSIPSVKLPSSMMSGVDEDKMAFMLIAWLSTCLTDKTTKLECV